MNMKKGILVLGLMLSLVGCASSNDTGTTSETRVVSTLKGDVEIPTNPQRIVDISGATEELVLLEMNVVGTANIDSYITDQVPSYMADALEGVSIVGHSMMDTMDMEAILAAEPDLIIMSQRQEKIYEQLSAIAPTVMMKEYDNNWEERFLDVAALFEKTDVATSWLETYAQTAESLGESVVAAKGEQTYLVLLASTGGQFFVFSDAGIGSIIYDDMKLAKPDNMPEQDNISLPMITMEGLTEIDADHLFIMAGASEKQELEASSVFNSLRAVEGDEVTYLELSPYFTQGYNPMGISLLLEELQAIMTK
ncbi:MAG: ABC transporter substrate-binding protein [Erysipelotrichaceae bacterium]